MVNLRLYGLHNLNTIWNLSCKYMWSWIHSAKLFPLCSLLEPLHSNKGCADDQNLQFAFFRDTWIWFPMYRGEWGTIIHRGIRHWIDKERQKWRREVNRQEEKVKEGERKREGRRKMGRRNTRIEESYTAKKVLLCMSHTCVWHFQAFLVLIMWQPTIRCLPCKVGECRTHI